MGMKKTSYYQRQVIIMVSMLGPPVYSVLWLNFRNQAKLQAYQREYAWWKRAPGCWKVSKAERQLLEEQYVKKQLLMETEGPSQTSSTALSQYILSSLTN
jgi:hypothetical protein